MSSAVDIANQALAMLGSKPIISFNDDTTESAAVNTVYDPVFRNVLRMHEWGCTTKVATLALKADPPADTYWHYLYAQPTDTVRIIDVFTNGIDYYNRREWQIEGKDIVSRIPNALARYTAKVREPDLDSHVEALLVARLAAELAYPLTASTTREQTLYAMFEQKLREARTTDNLEGTHTGFRIDGLQIVRF